MIRVNLLPERVRAAEALQRNIVLSGALVAAALLAATASYVQKRTALKIVQKEIEGVRAEMESPALKNVVQAVVEFTAQRQALDSEQAVVNGLRQKQVALLRLMDILPDVLPPRLWLTDLNATLDKGSYKVVLKGSAYSPQEVAQFFSNLENHGKFKAVNLDSLPGTSTSQMRANVVTFQISLSFEA
jgi:Tfp pilus assembly protein PilN